jgi:DNA-binding winged helix-turn-helix (wHTH) protein/Tol biopolymer transport system component
MMGIKSFVYRFGDFEVREREFLLVKAGEVLPVEPKAFRALLFLLRNPQKLIPKEEMVHAVWGETAVADGSLTRCIWLLRRLLGDDFNDPRYIVTVATVGYRFICPVEAFEDTSGESEAPLEPIATSTGGKERNRRRLWGWALAAGGVLTICLATASWYLLQPPPPRITAYVQITHDGHAKFLGGTDGSRLYFTESSPQTIEQVSVSGGEVAPVPTTVAATSMVLMDISPNGTNALIGTNEPGHAANPMWVAPLVGGAAKRLGDGENEAFSPDGLSVIYSTVEGDIYLTRIDGTENRKLAHVAPGATYFSWSPDRKAIRFAEGCLLWEMSSDGSGLHRLIPDWKEPGCQSGRWTHDGRFYLIVLEDPSTGSQIWALDERRRLFGTRSSPPIRLTTGPIHWNQLVPSRDGTKIFAEGITMRGELSRIDPRAGVLQPFLGGISAEFASFSPDGRFVAYVSFPEGTLWRADRDGANRVQLASGPYYAINPRWSPDSKQILFTAMADGNSSIHLVSTEGGNPQRLLPGETSAGDGNWSADGKKIVFGRNGIGADRGDLRILDLVSGKQTVIPGSSVMYSPRWSPDRRFITALFADQRPSLPVFDFKTQKWSMLPVSGNLGFPSFSRDSGYIYFGRGGSSQGVFRIPVTGGKEERVIDLTNWHMAGVFGSSMSLDPTDAPLVLRDVGSDDIYALTLEVK